MRVEGHVGPSILPDGSEGVAFRQGRGAELVVSELHGKYYEQVARGNTYYGMSTTAAGIALIVAATGGGHPTLFNPAGSGVNLSVTHLYLTYTGGTTALNGIVWAYTLNAGSTQATGAGIATMTRVAPVNALIGSQNVAKGQWSNTANTFTAAPVVFAGIGVGLTAMTAAVTLNPFTIVIPYDGFLVLSPGTAISLCTTTGTTTATFNVTVVWEEIPI